MAKYFYEGPVKSFDRCISNCWRGETVAETEKKAKSNLTYQYKRSHGLTAATKISLPGDVKRVG